MDAHLPFSKVAQRDCSTSCAVNNLESGTSVENEEAPEFISDQCIFCGHLSGTFNDNITHMATKHSFIVPYQNDLIVDLESIIWYLHLVIYGYRECIYCATRRRTVEGTQQHMLAKGHCRFDVSSDINDFYEIPKSTEQIVLLGERELRLPLGKLLGRRRQPADHTARRASRPTMNQASAFLVVHPRVSFSNIEPTSHEIANTSNAMLAQLSRLSAKDRNTLANLPSSEVRSLLAVARSQLDRGQQDEMRQRGKLNGAGNQTLMKHFKPDIPKRLKGSWC